MRLDEALHQISDIRRQMAQSEVFRGCRAITVGFSGLLGLAAAALQPRLVASPAGDLGRYLGLWVGVAAISLAVALLEVLWRARRAGPGLAREHTFLAIEQVCPSVLVGGILTLFIYRAAPEVGWMLPGLWCLIFGLGVFASCRLMPRQLLGVGAYYLLCGFSCLVWGRVEYPFSPWLMAISFGGGQLLCAAVLHWALERDDGTSQST